MKQKKSQITLFIILGIVILLVVSLLIYFRESVTVFKPERVIPPQLKPLDEYVGGCINIIAREGISLIGANGGFIRFPPEIEADPFGSIRSSPLFNDVKNPMWHYRGNTRIPSEDYIKADLAWYIDQNIDRCLQNLSEFRQQFEIKELEPRKIGIELTDTGVDVILNYKLEIKSLAEQQKTTINDFRTNVPIRLKTVYELAKNIMEEEISDKFIELRTIDLIALDPSLPYTDIEFSCSPKLWYVADVGAKIKNLLAVNLPLFRVDKTSYAPVPDDQPYISNHYIWQVTEQKYPTTKVSFSYDPSWPLELYIRPNQGDVLRSSPQRGFDMMSFFCMNIWHFTYDIRYPVLATITDEEGKNHEAYTFAFAFEAGINRNRPDNTNFGISAFDFEQKARSEEFCEGSTLKNTLAVHTFENVSTDDAGEMYAEIDGVNLSYTCIRMTCPLGQSEWRFNGAVAMAAAELPYCVNGVLKGTKEGYEDAKAFVTTDAEKSADIYLTPIIFKDVEVVKHPAFGTRIESEEPLAEEQSAVVTLKRKNFKSIAMYPSNESQAVLSELKFLGKWDYTYELEVYLADDRTILGGYRSNWTVGWNDLKGADRIRIHVAEFPYSELPETQFEYISQLPEVSKQLPPPEMI